MKNVLIILCMWIVSASFAQNTLPEICVQPLPPRSVENPEKTFYQKYSDLITAYKKGNVSSDSLQSLFADFEGDLPHNFHRWFDWIYDDKKAAFWSLVQPLGKAYLVDTVLNDYDHSAKGVRSLLYSPVFADRAGLAIATQGSLDFTAGALRNDKYLSASVVDKLEKRFIRLKLGQKSSDGQVWDLVHEFPNQKEFIGDVLVSQKTKIGIVNIRYAMMFLPRKYGFAIWEKWNASSPEKSLEDINQVLPIRGGKKSDYSLFEETIIPTLWASVRSTVSEDPMYSAEFLNSFYFAKGTPKPIQKEIYSLIANAWDEDDTLGLTRYNMLDAASIVRGKRMYGKKHAVVKRTLNSVSKTKYVPANMDGVKTIAVAPRAKRKRVGISNMSFHDRYTRLMKAYRKNKTSDAELQRMYDGIEKGMHEIAYDHYFSADFWSLTLKLDRTEVFDYELREAKRYTLNERRFNNHESRFDPVLTALSIPQFAQRVAKEVSEIGNRQDLRAVLASEYVTEPTKDVALSRLTVLSFADEVEILLKKYPGKEDVIGPAFATKDLSEGENINRALRALPVKYGRLVWNKWAAKESCWSIANMADVVRRHDKKEENRAFFHDLIAPALWVNAKNVLLADPINYAPYLSRFYFSDLVPEDIKIEIRVMIDDAWNPFDTNGLQRVDLISAASILKDREYSWTKSENFALRKLKAFSK